jgi:hypothetical protein
MSTSVFPSNLPGMDVSVVRGETYKTTINATISGKEQRTLWESTPRYKYKLKFNVLRDDVSAPAPWAAFSEVATVVKFLEDHKGSWDSFHFADPFTGADTVVRYVDDSLELTQIVPHCWSCELSFISVK